MKKLLLAVLVFNSLGAMNIIFRLLGRGERNESNEHKNIVEPHLARLFTLAEDISYWGYFQCRRRAKNEAGEIAYHRMGQLYTEVCAKLPIYALITENAKLFVCCENENKEIKDLYSFQLTISPKEVKALGWFGIAPCWEGYFGINLGNGRIYKWNHRKIMVALGKIKDTKCARKRG